MGTTLLADNFFSAAQYPNHSVYTSASTTDPFKVGTARRGSQNFSSFPFGSGNIRVDCDRVRSADTIVIDRNSILGLADPNIFRLIWSSDNFSTWGTAIDIPPVDQVVLGSGFDDPPHWIKTDEGAFICHFPEVAAKSWRLDITAAIATTVQIGGMYLGKSFTPTYCRMPFDDEASWSEFDTIRRGLPNNDWRSGKSFVLNAMMASEAEWNEMRRVRELLKSGHPTWVVPSVNRVERSGLYYLEGGTFEAPFSERPQGRSISLSLSEYQPVRPR